MTNRAELAALARMLSDVSMGDITEAEEYFNQVKTPRPHLRLNKHEHHVASFQVGLSDAFHNKENLTGNKAAMANSFVVRTNFFILV